MPVLSSEREENGRFGWHLDRRLMLLEVLGGGVLLFLPLQQVTSKTLLDIRLEKSLLFISYLVVFCVNIHLKMIISGEIKPSSKSHSCLLVCKSLTKLCPALLQGPAIICNMEPPSRFCFGSGFGLATFGGDFPRNSWSKLSLLLPTIFIFQQRDPSLF